MAQKYQKEGSLIIPDPSYFIAPKEIPTKLTLSEIEKVFDEKMEHYVSRLERKIPNLEEKLNADTTGTDTQINREAKHKLGYGKYAYSLLISSIVSGGLLTIFGLSFVGLLNTIPLFWLVASLPFMGIAIGTLMIVLGVDGERYA